MKKRLVKGIAVTLFLVFAGLQFFRINTVNAPVVESNTLEAAVEVPGEVAAIISVSCNDCHSNKTVYPWYSQVAPMSWLLERDIDQGRQALNFSEFNTYSSNKKLRRLESICELTQRKEMPLPSYLLIHRNASLTDSQIGTLCDWTARESDKLKSKEEK